MSTKRGIGNSEYLKKRIPQNPKYQHVKSRLDTGSSLLKYMERLEEIKKNYRYKKGELFKRLKVTTFAQLVIQVASVAEVNDIVIDGETSRLEDNISVLSGSDGDCPSVRPNGSPAQFTNNNGDSGDTGNSARSTLQSVISGVGELDLERNGQRTGNLTPESSPGLSELPYPDCPYLLLDVRDRDDYDQCHIVSAYSYPVATLSRTMNPYTKEVLEYKNAPGKIIILYDEDERIASQAATTMCERGFENLFMLSGGLKVSRRAEKRWRFTSEDLGKIQLHMEEAYLPSEPGSRLSRMSMSSAQSKLSSARSRQTPSTAGSDSARSQSSRPWK
ncbi:hypothetical protein AAFF_G00061320 [Aldrovandia affinis]|uniref:Rhodanese domain-containing protein n=1 Tax=Aldrovandia affinis TaxID=143900 RepID=A0AAD7S048_9TELE|nr:hypothetical protein AAFF_G00061320 [Aldrovandia affinis]